MRQFTLDQIDGNDSGARRGKTARERLEECGAAALSDSELLTVLLAGNSNTDWAKSIISEAGSIAGLASWHAADFRRIPGIGKTRASQLEALLEATRRVAQPAASAAPQLNRADLISAHMTPIIWGLEVEKFWVICLNRKNRLKKVVEVTSGTATAALAHPREVFRAAIQHSAAAVVCVHNHPSGDPSPSAADIQVTRQLREAARALDIQLLDHVVVGTVNEDPSGAGYYSFRAAGLL